MSVLAVLAHAGVLLAVCLLPGGLKPLLWLNAAVACAMLLYAASRARYIWAARDWPHAALVVFELLVLAGASWALRNHRPAVIWSYVVFGLHGCISLGAVLYAFLFKMRLM